MTIEAGIKLAEGKILKCVAALRDDAVQMLGELVEQPSLLGEEASAQAYMEGVFRDRLGLRVERFDIDEDKIRNHPGYSPSLVSYDGRPNVVGVHQPQGGRRGKSLILNGHVDVVPVGTEKLWTRPPFEAWVEGDRLYGRGSSDMKAGIVAYSIALQALKQAGYEPAAPVFLQSVVEEECTGNGALACLVEGYTADAAIIPEPVGGVMTCQLGVMWLGITVMGVPAHAAMAQDGTDAIGFALYLFHALKKLEARWNQPESRHACYSQHRHPVNFNLGKIQGGDWTSSVASECCIDVRIGFYPGRTREEIKTEVEAVLKEAFEQSPHAASSQYEVTYQGFQAEGCVVDMNDPVIRDLEQAHLDVVGSEAARLVFTGTTDARFFNLYGGIPATCYGPVGGSIHGIDEWVSIQSMMEVAAVLAIFMARWCGLNKLPE
ncbi:acetylornithine deacetylase [Geopseudomonas sagittaria]|uniref:Acetylornithine deacetylase n=1 Tax=Geopseudomonas sagittaria TaxID=1135990 RepID=A0A1I5XHG2_9GAMM|nr:ArgE/DapE family deacylase [Pseudomonas sagittaria]MCM2329666.1 ArgE/DapE family deacylase [Pseudomonas sagittaria]SFQ31402.1 acetylornithine deacetylase [Pseudomonas sagittaria]